MFFMYGLPAETINALRRVQICAAHIDHMTPVLCKLHCIPLSYELL